MALIDEQYPLTTQDGNPIPLDIIKPSGLIFQDATNSAWADVTLPAGMTLATILATEDSYVDLAGVQAGALAVNTHYASVLYIPKGFIIATVVAAGLVRVRAVNVASRVFIQGIQRWATLSLPRQNTTITARG